MTPDYTRSRRIDRPQAQDVVQARGWAPSAYTPMPRATPAASCRAQRRTVAAAAPSAESASFVCAWNSRMRTRHEGRHRRAGAPPSVLCFCRLSSQTTSSSQALRLCRTAAGDMAAQPNDCRRRAGGAGCMPSWWARTLRRAADRRDRSDKGAHARSDAGVQAAHSEKPMCLARRCCTARCQQPWHSMLTTPFHRALASRHSATRWSSPRASVRSGATGRPYRHLSLSTVVPRTWRSSCRRRRRSRGRRKCARGSTAFAGGVRCHAMPAAVVSPACRRRTTACRRRTATARPRGSSRWRSGPSAKPRLPAR